MSLRKFIIEREIPNGKTMNTERPPRPPTKKTDAPRAGAPLLKRKKKNEKKEILFFLSHPGGGGHAKTNKKE